MLRPPRPIAKDGPRAHRPRTRPVPRRVCRVYGREGSFRPGGALWPDSPSLMRILKTSPFTDGGSGDEIPAVLWEHRSMDQRRRGRPPHSDILTPGEQRVLEELRRGGTNAEIAERLGIGRETVKTHISRMLQKLGLETRRELAAWRPERSGLGGWVRAALLPGGGLASPGQLAAWAGAAVVGVVGTAAVALAIVAMSQPPQPSPAGTDAPAVAPPAVPGGAPPTEAPTPTPGPLPTAMSSQAPTASPTVVDATTAAPAPIPLQPTAGIPEPSSVTPPLLESSPLLNAPPGVYTALTVGGQHVCALTDTDEAVCWGLADGAVQETPPGAYASITAGEDDTCAITHGGEIVCWDSRGKPIDGSRFDPSRDAPPGPHAALDMTAHHACAVTAGGEAVCWSWEGAWSVLPDPPAGRYASVSVGFFTEVGSSAVTACAATADGDVVCWQDAHAGGSPPPVERYVGDFGHVRVWRKGFCAVTASGEVVFGARGSVREGCGEFRPGGSSGYVGISAGRRHVCAVTEAGAAECATHGSWWAGRETVLIPPDRAGTVPYTAIGVGDRGACALVESGAAVCWRDVENRLRAPDPAARRYVAVSDGYGHTCALTDSGEAVCWGWNNFGQAEPPPGRYTAIRAAETSTCAVTEAGDALCWGFDYSNVFASGPYRAIATSSRSGCAVTEAGEAMCLQRYPSHGPVVARPGPFSDIHVNWWSGDICALGESGEAACWRSDGGEALVPPPGLYVDLSVNGGSACGVTTGGDVVCWRETGSWSPELPEGDYADVSTGGRHGCALTDAGEARCWGSFDASSKEGGVDHGPADPPPGRYSAISSGLHRACAVTQAGEVACWGDADYGERPEYYLY